MTTSSQTNLNDQEINAKVYKDSLDSILVRRFARGGDCVSAFKVFSNTRRQYPLFEKHCIPSINNDLSPDELIDARQQANLIIQSLDQKAHDLLNDSLYPRNDWKTDIFGIIPLMEKLNENGVDNLFVVFSDMKDDPDRKRPCSWNMHSKTFSDIEKAREKAKADIFCIKKYLLSVPTGLKGMRIKILPPIKSNDVDFLERMEYWRVIFEDSLGCQLE